MRISILFGRLFKSKNIRSDELHESSKSQITNHKWFDKLTTLSHVEGQITMTKIRNSKPVWVIEYCNLVFHCNLVLGI